MAHVYAVVRKSLLRGAAVPCGEFASFCASTGATHKGGAVPVDSSVVLMDLGPWSSNMKIREWIQALPAWCVPGCVYWVACDSACLTDLKNHLRNLGVCADESGNRKVWPWFNPDYLRLVLNHLEPHRLPALFGPIQWFGFPASYGMEQLACRQGKLWANFLPEQFQ